MSMDDGLTWEKSLTLEKGVWHQCAIGYCYCITERSSTESAVCIHALRYALVTGAFHLHHSPSARSSPARYTCVAPPVMWCSWSARCRSGGTTQLAVCGPLVGRGVMVCRVFGVVGCELAVVRHVPALCY